MKKVNELKKGDVVTYFTVYASRPDAHQTRVEKVGKQYITTSGGMRFNKESGYGEYGKQLYVGAIEDFEAWFALAPKRRDMRSKIELLCMNNSLDVPELTKIINFIQSLSK